MGKAFGKSSPEVKGLVAGIEVALKDTNYPVAYQRVQSLCRLPKTTSEQRMVATRAMLTLTGLVRDSQAQGDQSAAAVLKLQQRTR